MPKFRVYEVVPSWVSYGKTVEAANAEEALKMASENWSEIEGDESGPLFSDAVEGVAVKYEVEAIK